MDNKKRKKSSNDNKGCKIIQLAATLQNENKGDITSDVLGSYTGMANDNTSPEQDADDL